jgi:tetratricopeptide (TPR) repeat protein
MSLFLRRLFFIILLGALTPVWADDAHTPPLGQALPYREPPEPRAHVLDELFGRLKKADDEHEAAALSGAIQKIWMHSGSATADVLMTGALEALQNDQAESALHILNRLVWLEPDWAEAWNKRALVRYEMNDDEGALDDLRHVLSLEPRHYAALAGVGFILHRSGLDQKALEAMRLSLSLYPQQKTLRQFVDEMKDEVEGRDL